MTSTLTSYTLIARDLTAAMKRKAADPVVARESAYYAANIGKVKSVDDLLGDRRLYAYAMKAFGLEDMTYAKAFMRKVLSEGVSSTSSFANRLADDRYIAIAKAFDFTAVSAAKGGDAVAAGSDAAAASAAQITGTALAATTDFSGTNEARFVLTTQLAEGTTASATIVLNGSTLAPFASDLAAVTPAAILSALKSQIDASGDAGLKGKVQAGLDVFDRLVVSTAAYTDLGADGKTGGAGADADTAYAATGTARTVTLRVAAPAAGRAAVGIGFGTNVAPDLAAQSVTDAYLRQSIETEAGAEDTGVRLALYFARKAPTLKSAYDILGDTALTQVANTLIGLPASSSATSSEALAQRAKKIAEKIDLASLKDPAAVEKLVRRFAAVWDAQNNTASSPLLALFGDGSGSGLTADMMTALRAGRTGL